MKSRYAALSVLALVLAACSGTAAPTSQPGQPTTQPGQPTSPPVIGGAGTAVAHLVVASGPRAGTYDGTGVRSECNIDPTGSAAIFGDDVATEGLTTLLFRSGEGGASPTIFYLDVIFGVYPEGQEFGVYPDGQEFDILVDPANPRGSGTATLQDNGSTIKWTINGTSAGYWIDGTYGVHDLGMQATIECGPVDRR